MSRLSRLPHLFLASLLALIAIAPTHAQTATYRTAFARWNAANSGFATWQRSGLSIAADGSLQLDRQSAQAATDPYRAGSYYGRNFYNGASFVVGEAISPARTATFGFREAIASWNATTPSGTWTETQVRIQIGSRWSRWYNLGVWAADSGTIQRHSVDGQRDADARVAVDTLIVAHKTSPRGYQIKVRLFSANDAAPSLRSAALTISTTPTKPRSLVPGNPSRWNRVLPVPECSQMVYPGGGEVWCSPTSTSMVLAYWGRTNPCEPGVKAAVAGVYDWRYNGHGNWAFNTAYAGTHNLEGYVTRFTSLAQAEAWIAAGVPVVFSFSWKRGELTGAPASSSGGHLSVLVGFDAAGNPIVHDPYAPADADVQRTYRRAEMESLWLANSGGMAYLMYPTGWAVPNL